MDTSDEMLPDGIHFGVNADAVYHPHEGLGSGDVRRLLLNPAEFWWNSRLNPLRPTDTDSAFKTFGRAVHVRVLEGEEKFNRLYEREDTSDDMLRTDADLAAWLRKRDIKPLRSKAEKIAQALFADPGVKIEDDIKERAEKEGRTILKADDYDRIIISSALIADNPDLEHAFDGGMPEVAVIWTETIDGEPVRCKALFDYLKIRGIGDLKSTSNPKEMDFPPLCRIRFAERRMDLQAAHYMRGRSFIRQFVKDGAVFGDHDPQWLRKVADQAEYGFAFVFFQTTGAPSSWACSLSPENSILRDAAIYREAALKAFVLCRRKYGDGMWLKREPIQELDPADLPMWFGRR
ncbi:PDDEXK-like uncharacterized protein DUF3799 [Rhodopseudomonas faecalis]|uniref:PDDEXK-like uncharacterized protein DUF3799 n=1 Tax=Rhodopseudomonas faecalis TaxID=99655 RepID=A0A318TK26_9BRAD|nr:PD-(D/E)XK nuclease-like domain-containing protein [Rhodopseudomonas faecalis]PYF04994.1 PDDEXK-like uncharacterized protein DUF3799 [Rhodopseudomonas faecalis]